MFTNIESLIQWIESQKRMNPKVSLERFQKICALYGNPEKNQKYIHIGGTNGKGSTVAFLKTILREAGYNVASYISPYVLKFNERISYNDQFISDEEILEIGNYIISKYPLLIENGLDTPSFFEFVTLMAFIYFSKLKELDFVILEVGLGGLLDATNIIVPLVSVITNVSYDHMNVLGNSIKEIAKNKLGIVKRGVPLITINDESFLEDAKKVTEALNSPLLLVEESDIQNLKVSLEETNFDFGEYKNLRTKLLGHHQATNATLAITVIDFLKKSFPISKEAIYQGLEKTFWPGRLQVLSKDPYILIDGAHNIAGITALVKFIKVVKKDYLRVVVAISHDKNKEAMIPLLESIADEMVFSHYNYRRSEYAILLYELSNHPHKRIEDNLDTLIAEAKANKKMMTLFCGSLYLVSDILKKMN